MRASTPPIPTRWRAAAWLCLGVTLATGTLLRLQWTGRIAPPFNSQFLLHGHSHVALLGWAFIGIFGLVFGGRWGASSPGRGSPGVLRLVAESLFLVLIFAMTAAFIREGYAVRSTALSLVHVMISLILVWLYTGDVRERLPHAARRWIDLSMIWFVVAQLGPLLLAGGVWMGPAWIDAWVGFYLALLFNGWLTFAVLGLLVAGGQLEPSERVRPWMALGVLPTTIPALSAWFSIPLGPWIGWLGHLLFGGAILGVAVATLRARVSDDSVLHRSVVAALLLIGVLLPVGSVPGLHERVLETPMLVIGFVHLQLLGLVTGAILLLLYPHRRRSLPMGLVLAGGWAMIGILLGVGMANLAGRSVFLPVQDALTLAGAVALLGVLLLPLARGRQASPTTGSRTAPRSRFHRGGM